MPSFSQRSYKKELLDGANIPFNAIKKNMEELEYINQKLGGHRVTLHGIRKLVSPEKKTWDICEIGSGGADNLRAIQQWMHHNGYACVLRGIDINEACIAFAKEHPQDRHMQFIHSDYRQVKFDKKPDIIFSSLFCHHFTDEELVEQVQWMKEQSGVGFFINDLHRHPLAFYSIKMLTHTFSQSELVKNDAPLSVLRGFRKTDWINIFNRAGIPNFNDTWHWAFRWLITYRHDKAL